MIRLDDIEEFYIDHTTDGFFATAILKGNRGTMTLALCKTKEEDGERIVKLLGAKCN